MLGEDAPGLIQALEAVETHHGPALKALEALEVQRRTLQRGTEIDSKLQPMAPGATLMLR